MISKNAVIHPNVIMGNNVIVEDYCIIGLPFKGMKNQKTIIGDDSLIRAGTIIYAGNTIGSFFQTGNQANIRELNEIGDNVSIGTLSVLEHHISIKNGVRIHSQVFIPEYTVLEEYCWLGPNVVITNSRYPNHPKAKSDLNGVLIKKNAKIGANTTILPGLIIGERSLVGAGSVVTKDIIDNIIAAGNPAIVLREVDY